jgi:BirA family biotin operon repressor/biotin-[acetyl-CoA-carboxylase] ligase
LYLQVPNLTADLDFPLSPTHFPLLIFSYSFSLMTFEPVATPLLAEEWTTLESHQIHYHLNQLTTLATGQGWSVPLPPVTHIPIHIYDTVVSTNTILWQQIHGSGGHPVKDWQECTVAIARQQSAGKGQWGRQWQSSRGGLYLSMALKPHCPVAAAAQMTLSVVVGVAIALRRCGLPVLIKWPNDLVVPSSALAPVTPQGEGQILYKLGGMLTETRLQGQIISQAVVGIGINGANPVPPQGITVQTLANSLPRDERATSPRWAAPLMSLNGMGAIAIWGILTGWQRWQQQGIASILVDYNHLLSHRGQWVSFHHHDQISQGHIVGVNPDGNLRVRIGSPPPSTPVNSTPPPGTLSFLKPSSQEMLLTPGDIRLEYRLSSGYQGSNR